MENDPNLGVVVALVSDLAIAPLGDDGLLDGDPFVAGGGEFHDGFVERYTFTGAVAEYFLAMEFFHAFEQRFLGIDTEYFAAFFIGVCLLKDDVISKVSFHCFDESTFGEEGENALKGGLNGGGRVWVVGHVRLYSRVCNWAGIISISAGG